MNAAAPTGRYGQLPSAVATRWTAELAALLDGQRADRDEFIDRFFDDGADSGMAMVRHPLVHDFAVAGLLRDRDTEDMSEGQREMLERVDPHSRYLHKSDYIADAAAQQDWLRIVMMVERPYRADALLLLWPLMVDHLGADEAAAVVAGWWDDTEFPGENPAWDGLFDRLSDTDVSRPVVGDDLLPGAGTFTVWRGVHVRPGVDPDWAGTNRSWTLDRDTAEWFAHRFADHHGNAPWVMRATASHEAVWWASNDRGESEVVCDVGRLTDRDAEPV